MKYALVKKALGISVSLFLVSGVMMAPVSVFADTYPRGTGTQKTEGNQLQENGIEDADIGSNFVKEGVLDLKEGSGSLIIQGNEGQTLTGKKFELFRIFDSQTSPGQESINYTFNATYKKAVQTVVFEALKEEGQLTTSEQDYTSITEYRAIDYIQSLNTKYAKGADTIQLENGYYSSFRYFTENLRTEIKNEGISGTLIAIDSPSPTNSATISGLSYGYYIVDERSTSTIAGLDPQDPNNPSDQWFASSLLMINTVQSEQKMTLKSDYPGVIKKIREDDNPEEIGNDGYNDIGDYEIGQTIPYEYTSSVPNMNGKDTYFYAFHDQADSALTPYLSKSNHPSNSTLTGVSITISGTDAAGKTKTYTLTDDEYILAEPGDTAVKPDGKTSLVDEEDSFVIAISDLKAICDREFPHFDENLHNDYSDEVIKVNYTMTLNETASERTGRPGFENRVRLEYSNNMDSNGGGDTGYTPWDTVVAFTYRLDGLKTNDQNKALEGARFRLYSDADLTEEVVVKESTSGNRNAGSYVVMNRDSLGGHDHTGGETSSGDDIVSDANGNFAVIGLDQGTYYLKEVQAPDGYRLLEKPIKLVVTPTYTSDRNTYVRGAGASETTLEKLAVTAQMESFYDQVIHSETKQLQTNVEDGSADLTVVNRVGSKLPITGSSAMLVMLGSGTILMTGGIILNRNSKRKESER